MSKETKQLGMSINKRMLLIEKLDGSGFQIWTRSTETSGIWKKYDHEKREVAQEIFDDYNATFPEVRKIAAPTEARVIVKPKKVRSDAHSPVAKFKELYAEHGEGASRAEMIALAEKEGISKATASTYYYKLKKEAQA